MHITVKLFAAARDAVGRDTVDVFVAATPPTIGRLRKALSTNHPELAAIVSHAMFAIDEEYRCDETEIPASATVVCIPPVSGG